MSAVIYVPGHFLNGSGLLDGISPIYLCLFLGFAAIIACFSREERK